MHSILGINFWLYHWILITVLYFITYGLYRLTEDDVNAKKHSVPGILITCLCWPFGWLCALGYGFLKKKKVRYVVSHTTDDGKECRIFVINQKDNYIKIPVNGCLGVSDDNEEVFFSYRDPSNPEDIRYRKVWATNYVEYLKRKSSILDMPHIEVTASQIKLMLDGHYKADQTLAAVTFTLDLS